MADPLNSLNGLSTTSLSRSSRRVSTAGGSAFDAALPDVPELSTPEPFANAQIGAVNPMLLHELAVDGEGKRDREAHRHGTEVLDLLAEMQRGLLGSGIDSRTAGRLASLVEKVPDAATPALAAACRAVLLRARIEIARHVPTDRRQD